MTKDKKGSVTIFIMVFFVSLVTLIFAFINGSKVVATKSITTSLGQVWATSILAEYDINLQKRYNIFGYYGMNADINDKIDMYAEYSFNDKKYINYDGCSCQLYEYSLANAEVMRKQMVEVGKLVLAGNIIKPTEIVKPEGTETLGEIKNEQILSALPSKGVTSSFSLTALGNAISSGSTLKDLAKEGTDNFLETQYMFAYFKDMSNSKDLGDTFFQNEIEYIICGKPSDSSNATSIKTMIIGIREVLNFAFAVKDPKMSAEAMAAAQVITPGPAGVLTQKGLLAAWALAESYNDYKLLIDGKKVPLIKTEISWAIDLQSVIDNTAEEYVDPGTEAGETYEDYLTLFAYAMDEDVKVLRMMDLIQINMKYMYYGDFDLKNYNGGIDMNITVNGDDYNVKKEY